MIEQFVAACRALHSHPLEAEKVLLQLRKSADVEVCLELLNYDDEVRFHALMALAEVVPREFHRGKDLTMLVNKLLAGQLNSQVLRVLGIALKLQFNSIKNNIASLPLEVLLALLEECGRFGLGLTLKQHREIKAFTQQHIQTIFVELLRIGHVRGIEMIATEYEVHIDAATLSRLFELEAYGVIEEFVTKFTPEMVQFSVAQILTKESDTRLFALIKTLAERHKAFELTLKIVQLSQECSENGDIEDLVESFVVLVAADEARMKQACVTYYQIILLSDSDSDDFYINSGIIGRQNLLESLQILNKAIQTNVRYIQFAQYLLCDSADGEAPLIPNQVFNVNNSVFRSLLQENVTLAGSNTDYATAVLETYALKFNVDDIVLPLLSCESLLYLAEKGRLSAFKNHANAAPYINHLKSIMSVEHHSLTAVCLLSDNIDQLLALISQRRDPDLVLALVKALPFHAETIENFIVQSQFFTNEILYEMAERIGFWHPLVGDYLLLAPRDYYLLKLLQYLPFDAYSTVAQVISNINQNAAEVLVSEDIVLEYLHVIRDHPDFADIHVIGQLLLMPFYEVKFQAIQVLASLEPRIEILRVLLYSFISDFIDRDLYETSPLLKIIQRCDRTQVTAVLAEFGIREGDFYEQLQDLKSLHSINF